MTFWRSIVVSFHDFRFFRCCQMCCFCDVKTFPMFDSFVPSLSLIEGAYQDSSGGRGEQNGSNQIDDFRILNSEVISSYGGFNRTCR